MPNRNLPNRTVFDTPQCQCRFGIARTDITPPVGIYHRMWGAAVHDRAAGVHRPLLATAIALAPAQPDPGAGSSSHPYLVTLDHCLFGQAEMESLYAAITRRTGIAREQLLVVFSHTHAAGLLGMDRVQMPGGELIPAYFEMLAERVSQILTEAGRHLRSATIRFDTGHCGLAKFRDYWDESREQFVCGFDPSVRADDTVLVGRVEGDGKTLATLVNYACHPTTLAWDNQLISPDYPGALRELVEQQTGAPCVFLQGASGELGPREGYVGDVAVADRNGRQLGYAALETLESMLPGGVRMEYVGPVVSGATLGAWNRVPLSPDALSSKANWKVQRPVIALPYREELPTMAQVATERDALVQEEQQARQAGDGERARELRALVERKTRMIARLKSLPPGESFPYEATIWQIGDVIWIGLPGEPYNLIQTALRERFPDKAVVVMTLAGGWGPSYLPTRETYGKGIYQESIALTAPGSLEQVIAEIVNCVTGADQA